MVVELKYLFEDDCNEMLKLVELLTSIVEGMLEHARETYGHAVICMAGLLI